MEPYDPLFTPTIVTQFKLPNSKPDSYVVRKSQMPDYWVRAEIPTPGLMGTMGLGFRDSEVITWVP